MSAHRVLNDLYRAFEPQGPGILSDPGASGSIIFDMYGQTCLVTTATTETRTLAVPNRPGILASIVLDTDGGTMTLTVTGGYNNDDDTAIVFDDAGDMIALMSIKEGTSYFWRVISQEGTDATIESSDFDSISIGGTAITATAAEINAAADVLTEAVTTTNIIAASENGTRFVLNSATGFVSTLPVPAAGLEFWFYIGATAPTTSHTIVTNASANIIEGSIGTPETPTTAVSCAAAADTISFIANKAVRGDFAHVWSDGTNWFLNGMCFVQDGMTTTQAT